MYFLHKSPTKVYTKWFVMLLDLNQMRHLEATQALYLENLPFSFIRDYSDTVIHHNTWPEAAFPGEVSNVKVTIV